MINRWMKVGWKALFAEGKAKMPGPFTAWVKTAGTSVSFSLASMLYILLPIRASTPILRKFMELNVLQFSSAEIRTKVCNQVFSI
jgi:hypothetical protein